MSKAKKVSRILHLVTTLFAHVMKLFAIYAPRLIKVIISRVSKQLRFSITFKTVTSYTFMIASILLTLSFFISISFAGLLYYEAKKDLNRISGVTLDFITEDKDFSREQIERYAEIEGVTITLLNTGMEVEYSTQDNEVVPEEVLNTEGATLLSSSIYFRSEMLASEVVKYIVVSRFYGKEALYMAIMGTFLAIGIILSISISIFKGSKNLKRMLKPIDDMIDTARSMSANKLHTRLNVVDSHDELKDLAETFNEMLDRIQAAYDHQERFVSDASHELRTPISVIQGYANLLERWGKEDKEVLDESVTAIKNEAESMKNLVERLLFLARADKETQKINKTLFPLEELITEVAKETKIIDSQHRIEVTSNAMVNITADRGLIKQALRVFIDNSIKYTPKGGVININSFLSGSYVRIFIEDNGVGIPAEELPYVFNRFYKCDRSRNRGSGGTGLGLSIAKWIIEKHKGTVSMESEVDKGTRVNIRLPNISI